MIGGTAAVLVAAEHTAPAYGHMVLLGGIVVAALVVFGVGWWRRRQRERTNSREEQ
jgi:O-antigen/teichoic acid export membrane protein